MKVPASIRRVFEDQLLRNEPLRGLVDTRLRSLKNTRWHYESRLKGLESFALKVESGRVAVPSALEDFFACTIVVQNAADLSSAEGLVRAECDLVERRPTSNDRTAKAAECFPFDDLRLYVRWRDDPTLPPTGVAGMVFEVQIKTFLQHAWAIATHDLVYKTAEPEWSKQRVAYQIKAMLEHAEASIEAADQLAFGQALTKTTTDSRRITEIITMLRSLWGADDLPTDVRRLASNIDILRAALQLEVADLRAILEQETAEGRGSKTLNLSPFGAVTASLLRHRKSECLQAMTDATRKGEAKIFIPAEIELPLGVVPEKCCNAIILH